MCRQTEFAGWVEVSHETTNNRPDVKKKKRQLNLFVKVIFLQFTVERNHNRVLSSRVSTKGHVQTLGAVFFICVQVKCELPQLTKHNGSIPDHVSDFAWILHAEFRFSRMKGNKTVTRS